LIGFLVPIILLKRQRKASRRHSKSNDVTDSSRSDPIFSDDKRSKADDDREPQFAQRDFSAKGNSASRSDSSTEEVGEWYYSNDGKRVGPMSQHALLALLRTRELLPNAMVWRTGMRDWARVFDSELAQHITTDSPPPLSAKHIANGYAWALASAPLWATALHIYVYLGAKYEGVLPPLAPFLAGEILEKTWYFGWIVNVLMALLDDRALKSAGWGSEKLNSWMVFLVPIYLYKRDQMLGEGMARFWVWIGAVVVSLLPIW
jgi:hypothetical protein